MWWRRVRRPVVGWFDRSQVQRLRAEVESTRRPAIVVDLAGVDGFDSAALGDLLDLQEQCGTDRIAVEGLEQAAVRLLGLDRPPERIDLDAEGPEGTPAVRVSVLYGTVVMQAPPPTLALRAFERAVADVLVEPAGIVVLDLLGVREVSPPAVTAIAELAGELAYRQRRFIIVNAHVWVAAHLHHAGLPPDTTVAVDETTSLPDPSPRARA